jgi:lactoylglutathione lyase
MTLNKSGVILFTEHYQKAVSFYENVLGLGVRERKTNLTVFDFGGSYLMVEVGGFSSPIEKDRHSNPTVLRLDIDDFDETVLSLKRMNVPVEVDAFDWGRIGSLVDPDGNRIELKDSKFQAVPAP